MSSMPWSARLRAAWRGEVPDADLAALFATTASLTDIQQALEDRRLAAQIEHAGHDWRAVLAVGKIAAPIWLAEALVDLAGAIYDAETGTRPDHPASVSAYTHDVVAALLAPLEDIIADVSAALADPGHRTALTTPLHIGPGGAVANLAPLTPTVAFVRGLSAGARRVQTSAATALAAVRKEVVRSPSPDWLTAGLQRLDGELQAAAARLDMVEVRLTSLAEPHNADAMALSALCRDLWKIVDTAVVAGQILADPHLMPEAAAAPRRDTLMAPVAPPSPPVSSPPVSLPPVAPRPLPPAHVTLPRIEAGAAPLRERRDTPPLPARNDAAPSSQDTALPLIGERAQPPAPDPRQPSNGHQYAKQRSKAPATDEDETPRFPFPDIGTARGSTE